MIQELYLPNRCATYVLIKPHRLLLMTRELGNRKTTAAVGPNCIERYNALVDTVIARLSAHPNTRAIALLGGLGSRRYLDQFSDLDIAVFVESGLAQLPPFSFFLRVGGNDVEFNLTQHALRTQYYRWEPEKRSAYRDGLIVFDPAGNLRTLIDSQLSELDEDFKNNTILAINQLFWKGIRHSLAAAARGFPESAHSLINEGIHLAIQALFSINKLEAPHGKWQFDELDRLPIKPANIRERLTETLLVRAMHMSDVERRAKSIRALHSDIKDLAMASFEAFPEDPYKYWAAMLSGRQLNRITVVDRVSEALGSELSPSEHGILRGSLSMAMLLAPRTDQELWALARGDGFAPPYLLDKAEMRIPRPMQSGPRPPKEQ